MANCSFFILIMAVAVVQASIAFYPAKKHSASTGMKKQLSLLSRILIVTGHSDTCMADALDMCITGQGENLNASLIQVIPPSSTADPAEEHTSSGMKEQRSLISTMLMAIGYSDTCVTAALDVCSTGQGEKFNASLIEEARELVQQVSASTTKWDSQLSGAVKLIDYMLSAAENKSEFQLSTVENMWDSQLSAVVNKIEAMLSAAENKSESQLSDVVNKIESMLSAAENKSESQLSDVVNKIESHVNAAVNKIEFILSASENKSESMINSAIDRWDSQVSVVINKSVAENKSESRPRNCKDLLISGDCGSGLRQVYPYPDQPLRNVTVVCDHTTDGGGWQVFQRRTIEAPRQNFKRNWQQYQEGFGDLQGEFWIGLNLLHKVTSTTHYQLRIDLEDYEGQHRWAKYGYFNVGGPWTNYRLAVGDYSGTAGDSLTDNHNGQQFSTYDADHDTSDDNCASSRGGWWYYDCLDANLNGYQYVGESTPYARGITWYEWKGYYYSLKQTTMKIRPA